MLKVYKRQVLDIKARRMRRLDSHSASDHQKPMRDSSTVPCGMPAVARGNHPEGRRVAWHCLRLPHRFLMIRRTVAIYATHSPRSDIHKYVVSYLLIKLIKRLINIMSLLRARQK